jgi:hypothetical protein
MIILDCEQGSEEWHKERCGVVYVFTEKLEKLLKKFTDKMIKTQRYYEL